MCLLVVLTRALPVSGLQTAEFMGSDPLMAALGLRISLIAYPVVALSKASVTFLQAVDTLPAARTNKANSSPRSLTALTV